MMRWSLCCGTLALVRWLGFGVWCWAAATVSAQTLHIGRSDKVSPLTDRGEAVLRAAYAAIGVDVVFEPLPLRRSLELANVGQIDGDMMRVASLGANYANLLRVATPVNHFDIVVYALRPCPALSDWQALHGHRIAYERGVLAIEQGMAGMETAEAADTGDVLKLLHRQAVDYGVLVDMEAAAALAVHPLRDVCRVQPFAEHVQLYHYLNKRHADIARRLQAQLAAMAKSGEIERILVQATVPAMRK